MKTNFSTKKDAKRAMKMMRKLGDAFETELQKLRDRVTTVEVETEPLHSQVGTLKGDMAHFGSMVTESMTLVKTCLNQTQEQQTLVELLIAKSDMNFNDAVMRANQLQQAYRELFNNSGHGNASIQEGEPGSGA